MKQWTWGWQVDIIACLGARCDMELAELFCVHGSPSSSASSSPHVSLSTSGTTGMAEHSECQEAHIVLTTVHYF